MSFRTAGHAQLVSGRLVRCQTVEAFEKRTLATVGRHLVNGISDAVHLGDARETLEKILKEIAIGDFSQLGIQAWLQRELQFGGMRKQLSEPILDERARREVGRDDVSEEKEQDRAILSRAQMLGDRRGDDRFASAGDALDPQAAVIIRVVPLAVLIGLAYPQPRAGSL